MGITYNLSFTLRIIANSFLFHLIYYFRSEGPPHNIIWGTRLLPKLGGGGRSSAYFTIDFSWIFPKKCVRGRSPCGGPPVNIAACIRILQLLFIQMLLSLHLPKLVHVLYLCFDNGLLTISRGEFASSVLISCFYYYFHTLLEFIFSFSLASCELYDYYSIAPFE